MQHAWSDKCSAVAGGGGVMAGDQSRENFFPFAGQSLLLLSLRIFVLGVLVSSSHVSSILLVNLFL